MDYFEVRWKWDSNISYYIFYFVNYTTKIIKLHYIEKFYMDFENVDKFSFYNLTVSNNVSALIVMELGEKLTNNPDWIQILIMVQLHPLFMQTDNERNDQEP